MREVIPAQRPEPSPKLAAHARLIETQIAIARIVLALLVVLLLGFLCAMAKVSSH
jgi:hypothetical protein